MADKQNSQKPGFEGGGLVLFEDVREAVKGERALNNADYSVRLVSPPAELRKGCDLAVEFDLIEQPGVERLLAENQIGYLAVLPLRAVTSELLGVVRVTDFGQWLMVKAGNMKLTFDKESEEIVNTSGGGCPDIPVMHAELIGKKLTEAPRPKDIGFTLCSLMLDKALEESLILRNGDKA